MGGNKSTFITGKTVFPSPNSLFIPRRLPGKRRWGILSGTIRRDRTRLSDTMNKMDKIAGKAFAKNGVEIFLSTAHPQSINPINLVHPVKILPSPDPG